MMTKATIATLMGGLSTALLLIAQPAAANDRSFGDDNEYFASKYHYRHPYHWNHDRQLGSDTSTYRGRDRHRGIHLDGHDGDA